MESENEFYIFLPSDENNNDNNEGTVENTLSNFTINLPKPKNLTSPYKVGLAQISFPVSWHNLPNDEKVYFVPKVPIKKYIDKPIENFCITIPAGEYDSMSLIQTINDMTLEFFKSPDVFRIMGQGDLNEHITFSLDKNNKTEIKRGRSKFQAYYNYRMLVLMEKYGVVGNDMLKNMERENILKYENNEIYWVPYFSKQLMIPLGFWNMSPPELSTYIGSKPFYTSKQPVDLKSLYSNIFVYTDIIKHTIVGHTLAPLLRTISVNQPMGSVQENLYTDPFYHALSHDYIDSINISLRDITGEFIKFTKGRVVVTLHFLKIKKSNVIQY